jgi:hypothetical protein
MEQGFGFMLITAECTLLYGLVGGQQNINRGLRRSQFQRKNAVVEPADKRVAQVMTFRILQILIGLLVGTEALRALGAGYYGNYIRFPFYVLLGIAICMILAGAQKQTVSVKFLSVVSMLLLSSALLAAALVSFRLPPEVLGLSPISLLSVLQLGLVAVYFFTASSPRFVSGGLLCLTFLPLLVLPFAYLKRRQNGEYAQYSVSVYRTSVDVGLEKTVELLRGSDASILPKEITDSLVSVGRLGRKSASSKIAVVLRTEPTEGLQLSLPVSGMTVALHNSSGWHVSRAFEEYQKGLVLVPAPQGVSIMSDRQEAGWHGFSVDDGN